MKFCQINIFLCFRYFKKMLMPVCEIIWVRWFQLKLFSIPTGTKHIDSYKTLGLLCQPIPNIVLCWVLEKMYKKCITIYVLKVSLYKSCTTIDNSKLCTEVVHYYLFFCSTSFHEIMYDVIQPTYYFKKEFQLMYLFSTLLFIML